jgi:AcrR family transcriptional regulator
MGARRTAEQRKVQIIDAVLDLADRGGPDRLTTGAVAETVGISQPALFRHFPSKQDLWSAVASRIRSDMEDQWQSASRQPEPPLARLRLLVDGQLRLIRDVPAIPAILFSRELHSENRVLRGVFQALMRRFHARIAGLLRAAQGDSAIDADLDPSDVAFLVMSIVQGVTLRWSVAGRDFDLVREGLRLFDLQLQILDAECGNREAKP